MATQDDLPAFLRSLPPTVCAEVLQCLTERIYTADEVVFLEGTLGETFYIVLDGAVNILQNHQNPEQDGEKTTVSCNGTETLIVQLGRGASFGELSILGASGSERKRAASAVAASPHGTKLGRLSRDDYLRLVQQEQRRQTNECATHLRSVRALRTVSTLSLTRMSVLMRKNRIAFKRGETILAQGDVPTRLCVLTSGEVLIRAKNSISVDNEDTGRDPSIFAPALRKAQLHDLLILACGAGGAAEIVGESCCVEPSQASRASVATFVAHSARVEGFYLPVDDVDRLTGVGRDRIRTNKAFAVTDGGGNGSPLRLALQALAAQRSAQLRQRLCQTLSVARTYVLEQHRQAKQRHLRRFRDNGQDSGRLVDDVLAMRGVNLSSRGGNTKQYSRDPSNRLSHTDTAGSPRATTSGGESAGRLVSSARFGHTAASSERTSSRLSGSRCLALRTSVSSRATFNNGAAASARKQQADVEPTAQGVHRCPSFSSWFLEVSCAPTTPRRGRLNCHPSAAPTNGARLASSSRSAARVRMTPTGLYSVPTPHVT